MSEGIVNAKAWWRRMDWLILVAVVIGWFVLQKYILPAFGVPT
jgi:hypothetical protein